MSKTIKLSGSALSALETDVRELAADPEGYGLDEQEAQDYRALDSAVDYSKGTLTLPDDAEAADRMSSLVTDLSNAHDAIAEGSGSFDNEARKFARSASKSLATTGSKLIRHAVALQTGARGGQYYVSPSGAKVYIKSNPGAVVLDTSNPLADKYQVRSAGPWRAAATEFEKLLK